MATRLRSLGCALALFHAGCTFITECPPVEGNATGGSGGTGNGSGTGGSGGSGGSSSIISGDPPEGEWVNAAPDLGDKQYACGPITLLSARPDEDMLLAGVYEEGLWGSRDGGDNWEPIGINDDDDPIAHSPSSILYDPENDGVFWETGIYGNSGGVFRTDDGGETFVPLGDIRHNDFISVDFTDPDRQTMLVTGHEAQILHKSTDGGETWTDIGENIPEGVKVCSIPWVVDAETYLLGCGGWFDQGMPAILRSTDAGESWDVVHDSAGVRAPLLASDGSIYWADEFGGGLARSEDQGETWTQVVDGVVGSVTPVELPDGRIATLAGGNVVVSDDEGESWVRASAELPYEPSGFTYSKHQKAFFIWYLSPCALEPFDPPSDSIMRFPFDYETQ